MERPNQGEDRCKLVHLSRTSNLRKEVSKSEEVFYNKYIVFYFEGGLMVSALDSGSSSPGSTLTEALRCTLGQDTLIVPLFTQMYKWIPANLLLGVTLRWTSIPSRGE